LFAIFDTRAIAHATGTGFSPRGLGFNPG
jgi:hypothetical protein